MTELGTTPSPKTTPNRAVATARKWHLTWKGALGIAAAIAGALSASQGALPPSVAGPLATAGVVLVAIERYAEAHESTAPPQA